MGQRRRKNREKIVGTTPYETTSSHCPAAALLVPALNACTPVLSGATLELSPSSLQLRQGSSATVRVGFRRYVYGNEAPDGYRLSVTDIGLSGLRINTFKPSLAAADMATFTVEAARNAAPGRRSVIVTVPDPEGKGDVQRTLDINVVP